MPNFPRTDLAVEAEALRSAAAAAQLPGVVETVPTYAALLVTLDPLQTDADTLFL